MRFLIPFFAVAVLAVGVLTACNSGDMKAHTSSGSKPCSGPLPPDGACRVTVAELKDLLASNEAIVIDVRNQTSYDMGHIRGARLIPEAEVASHSDELPRNKLIVTYCS